MGPGLVFQRGFRLPRSVNKDVSGPLPDEDVIRTYRDTIRPLYAYVSRRVGGDHGLAEDLVQETWMRALDAWPRRGVPDDPAAWLMRVARNTLVSHFRRLPPQPIDPALIDLEADRFTTATPDAATIVGWGLARIRRAHAELLEAFYFEEKSVREIAEQRQMSERAVEGRLRRARHKLKKVLNRLPAARAIPRVPGESEGRSHAGPTHTS
jgi:RNA polymerase sigma factor (sigma-70 family)